MADNFWPKLIIFMNKYIVQIITNYLNISLPLNFLSDGKKPFRSTIAFSGFSLGIPDSSYDLEIHMLYIIIISTSYSEIIAMTTSSIFLKSEIFAFWYYMYELNPERNCENMPPFNHKTALHLYFFQTENQPTVSTKVNRDHNIRVHDSL